MLKKVILENFQKYLGVHEFELQDINFIIGPSDVGKSSLIRAICWVANLLSGSTKFISRGKKEAKVTLVFNDGIEVTKIVNTTNGVSYIYKTINGEIKEYNKCGNNLPIELKSILNFNELNIQFQLDPHFLLNKTSSEIYNKLNDFFNFSIWDDLQRLIIKSQNEIKQEQKILLSYFKEKNEFLILNKEKYEKAQSLIKQYSIFLEKLNDLKIQNNILKKYILFQKYNKIYNLWKQKLIFVYIYNLTILSQKKEYVEKIYQNLKKINFLICLNKFLILQEKYIKVEKIINLLKEKIKIYYFSYIQKQQQQIEKINKIINNLYLLKIIFQLQKLKNCEILIEKTKNLLIKKSINHLLMLFDNLISTTQLIQNLTQLKENKKCPLCGSIINEGDKNNEI